MKRFLIRTLWFSSLLLHIQATDENTLVVDRVLLDKEPAVNLLTAANYAILSQAGISTVPQSVITGNIAVSPIAATGMTGFGLIMDLGGAYSTASQVVGQAFGADYGVPTPALLTSAVGDMGAAYLNAAGRLNSDGARINMGGGLLGGAFGGITAPLTPGIYTFGSGVSILDTIYFEGTGLAPGQGDTDVFIIQMSGNLIQAADIDVILVNGALSKNIFWQIAGYVAIGAGAHLEGIILCKTAVTFVTRSSLNGCVYAQTLVALQMATINCAPGIPELSSDMPSTAPSGVPSAGPSVSAAPSVSTAPSGSSECTTTTPARLRRLQSTSLAERWNINDPAFTYGGLNFTLDFEINSYITDVAQAQYQLFDESCDNAYTGSGLVDSKGSGFFSNDGDGLHTIGVIVGVDSDAISTDTEVYSEDTSGSQVTAEIRFCIRFALHTPPAGGNVEVNFLETLVTLVVDLTDGFAIGEIAVEPYLRCEKEADEAFEVEGYFCTVGNEPNPNLVEIPTITQGELVKICVRPVLEARTLYIRMRRIQSFTFALADSLITQVAIANRAVAANGLTEMWCDPGYCICHFETILFADFYRQPGSVTGAGIADLQFGGEVSEQSVSPKNRRRQLRNLQEEDAGGGAAAEFDLRFSIRNADGNKGTSGAAGKTLITIAVALMSLTLLIV
jgi:hypothetical protein